MPFSATWTMFPYPTGFLLTQSKEVNSKEIKGVVGLRISVRLEIDF